MIRDTASLHRGLREAAAILDVLSECGFDVSTDKSVFLLELRGNKATQALKQVTCLLADGHSKGVRAGRWLLPLRTSYPYLGVILSFRNFEQLTYQHRREKAVQTFTRLSAVLRDHGALSVKDRVRLWKALVQPVLLYGLAAVGVTTDILKDLTGLVAKQIRVIGRCHSYYTRETNDQVFDKLSVELPRLTLLSAAEQCVRQSENLIALQPPRVLEWQQTVYSTLQQSDMTASTETASRARLTD